MSATAQKELLRVDSLTLGIGGHTLVSQLNLRLEAGQSMAILGRNGTGKTTLLHALLGFHPVQRGSISIAGRPLSDWSRKELATITGILFQNSRDEMPASVLEMTLMGRYPHLSGWQNESEADVESARAALRSMELEHLADRQISTLSGGERQRAALAMLLTQNPQLYLLDEPSNHLDAGFQIKALTVLQQQLRSGAGLCMATHDINLAARFCDRILLFLDQGSFLYGPSSEVMTEPNLSAAYGCPISGAEVRGRMIFFPG